MTPNVFVIITDDLGWGDIAAHGNRQLRTPHLDVLRGQSVRLNRYCSGPLCTPARAALMTGRYPYRTRAIDTYQGRSMMDPNEITLAQVLRDHGYTTGIFGKWHLGDSYPMRAVDRGFEEAVVHNGGGLRQPANIGRDSYFDPDLMHNGVLERYQGYCTDIYADAAIDFIRRHQSHPFLCYLATNAPHDPLEVAERWAGPYRHAGMPDGIARLYGMVENIDWNVGRVLAALDQLSLAPRTIVLFASDHGPRHDPVRFNGGLRDQKTSVYEGGIRAPCFWRWPGRFSAGVDIDRIANPIDVLPTLAAACGAAMPTDRAIDGVNLLPLLSGQIRPDQWPDRVICLQWHRGDQPTPYRNATAVGQRFKWISPAGWEERLHWRSPPFSAPDELYDLPNDPGERQNLAGTHPDLVAELRGAYARWFDDVSRTRPDNYAPPRITIGSQAERVTWLTRQDWRCYEPDHEQRGWGIDNPGFWEVQVARAGAYQISVDLPVLSEPGTLCVRCGGYAFRQPVQPAEVNAGLITRMIGPVPLASGPTRLEAVVERDPAGPAGRYGVDRVAVAPA